MGKIELMDALMLIVVDYNEVEDVEALVIEQEIEDLLDKYEGELG